MNKSELPHIEKFDEDVMLGILKYLSDNDINQLSTTSKQMKTNIFNNEKSWTARLKEEKILILDERMSNRTAYFYAKKQILTFKKLTSLKETYKDLVNHKQEYRSRLNFFGGWFHSPFSDNSSLLFFQSGDDMGEIINSVNIAKDNYESDLKKLVAQGYVCSPDEKTDINKLEVENYKKKLAARFCRFHEITFKNKLDENTLTELTNPHYPSVWSDIWYAKSHNNNVDRVKALFSDYNRKGFGRFLDYFTRHHTQKILKLVKFLDKNPVLKDEELVTFLIHNASFGTINLEGRFANMLQFVFDHLQNSVKEVLKSSNSEKHFEVSKLI